MFFRLELKGWEHVAVCARALSGAELVPSVL